MPENKFKLDSTRPISERDFSRGKEFDKPERSFHLRPEESEYLLATKIIAGTIAIGLLTYGAYRIGSSSVKLADKINDRLGVYLVDEQ